MTETTWIVVNIGCIECGVSSAIVGVFADEDRKSPLKAMEETIVAYQRGECPPLAKRDQKESPDTANVGAFGA